MGRKPRKEHSRPHKENLGRIAQAPFTRWMGPLRWIWDHPEVSVVLSGSMTVEQDLEDNLSASRGR